MGYETRESESLPLSKTYSSLYNEIQFNNWTPVKLVVTYPWGEQAILPKWPSASLSPKPYVEITRRQCNGFRINQDKGVQRDIPIPTTTITIPLEDIILYPVKVNELSVIISTEEHSLVAKNMLQGSAYSPEAREYLTDFEMVDPRLVFEVNDACNRWDALYVNVMGQTVKVRCHHGSSVPNIDAKGEQQCGISTLSCYLRYPSDYAVDEPETVPVFTINLGGLDLEEPYQIPSGDVVCVASSIEALQRVIIKKNSATQNKTQIVGMVSQEVHDKTVAELQSKLDQEKANGLAKVQTISVRKDSEIAELKSKIVSKDREIDSLKAQVQTWSTLHEATIDRAAHEDKLLSQVAKSRDEAFDRMAKRSDSTMEALKVWGTAIAAIAAVGVAIYKAKKG